jgi:predicted TIM-barrel fold metal-dependent hydrolase
MKKAGHLKSILICAVLALFICPVKGHAGSSGVNDSIQPRIDTHIHLYDTRRPGSSTFLDPVVHEKIYFPHLARQFVDTASPAGVEFAVVVEASQRREDNYWLLAHVDTTDALVAFIANLDPRDPMYVKDLDSLSKSKKFRGIRIRPATPIDISDPAIIKAFVELSRRNLVLELGGNGVDPRVVAAIARRFPNMNIIMNHLAGGTLSGSQIQPADWKSRLAVFASEPNVYCKVSALYEGSGKNPAPLNSDFYDVLIDPVVAAFGPDRVIFGSNWSLSDMLGSYRDMIQMLDDYCARHNLPVRKLYYENANRAYGINRPEVKYPGNGNGLLRSYWNGKPGGHEWFTDSLCSSIDPSIDEYWGTKSPGCGVSGTFWNARWVGLLEPLSSEIHTFYLTVNDYARVWVNNELIIDKWSGGSGNACYKGSIELIAGQQIPIKVDYGDLYNEAFIRLEWESPGLYREVIPVSQLYTPVITEVSGYQSKADGFSVFPNPADNRLTISGHNNIMDEVKVINLQGETIYQSKAGARELVLNISDWSGGLYFIEVRSLDERFVKKIMVN